MTNQEVLEQAILDENEPRWIAQGYRVIRRPRRDQAPAFLGKYTPDAIATGRSPGLIVEVVRKGDRHIEQKIRQLRTLLAPEADWRLEVLYSGEPFDDVAPTTIETMVETLRSVRHLADGEPRAALLLCWATLEALVRRLEPEKAIRAQTPGQVVELLASAGYIVPSEADQLRRVANVRNRLVHGDLSIQPTRPEVEEIADTIEALIEVLRRREAVHA
jgi:uncharacterized protein YutE (UPF0331/DUF86 family)